MASSRKTALGKPPNQTRLAEARSRRHRVLFELACIAAASLGSASCATPIVLLPEAKGLGAFVVHRAEPAPGVIDVHVRGLGVLYACGRLSLGWCEVGLVSVDSPHRSFEGMTSAGELAVGARAEERALVLTLAGSQWTTSPP